MLHEYVTISSKYIQIHLTKSVKQYCTLLTITSNICVLNTLLEIKIVENFTH